MILVNRAQNAEDVKTLLIIPYTAATRRMMTNTSLHVVRPTGFSWGWLQLAQSCSLHPPRFIKEELGAILAYTQANIDVEHSLRGDLTIPRRGLNSLGIPECHSCLCDKERLDWAGST